jgi:hypothetical protein
MTVDREFDREFFDALRSPSRPVRRLTAALETEQGTEILLSYVDDQAGADGRLVDSGVLFIPADTPENRRRARITLGCPLCPDVNQGLTSRDVADDDGSYVIAAYAECGHEVMARLDDDAEPLVLNPSAE